MTEHATTLKKLLRDPSGLLGAALLLLIAFPYIQFVPSSSYTQPFSLLLGSALFLMQFTLLWRLPFTDRVALIGLATLGTVLFLVTCIPYADVQEYKYLLNYITPLFVTVTALRYIESNPRMALRLIRLAIMAWIAVAALQKFWNPGFATFLLGEWGTHSLDIVQSGRGVISLAPEPTHHAFHILLLAACVALLDFGGRSRWLLLLCIADAVLLAASSSAILVLGMAGLVWLVACRPRWIILAAIVAALAWSSGVSVDWFLVSGTRAHTLISEVLADPANLMNIDYSLNIRLGGMSSVLIDTVQNAFAPRGISKDAWNDARGALLNQMTWLKDLSASGPPSGIGLLLFQTGLFGAPFIWLIFRRIVTPRTGMVERILLLATPFIFLSQYYISAPSFSLLYACALFRLGMAANTQRWQLETRTEPQPRERLC